MANAMAALAAARGMRFLSECLRGPDDEGDAPRAGQTCRLGRVCQNAAMNPRLLLLAALAFCNWALANDVSREEIDALMKPAVEGRWVHQAVIGIINNGDRRVIGYSTDSKIPDGQTLYEIGSITKTFTSTLLAEAIARGEMSLNDPVQKYLPPEVKMPVGKNGEPITLVQLATHSSGLPRMPTDFSPFDPGLAYASYTDAKLFANVSALRLNHEPGEKCLYSNLGVALLGQAVARQAHRDYGALLTEKVLRPLEMLGTGLTVVPSQQARLATPHDAEGNVTENWDLGVFKPAGALRSDADDMLKYLSAEIGPAPAELAPAIALTHQRQRLFSPGQEIALNWIYDSADGFYWHNGQTGGYHCCVAFQIDRKVGVVVLSNMAGALPDAICHGLLRRLLGKPLKPLHLEPTVTVEPAKLEALVGRYRIDLLNQMTVAHVDDHLTLRLTGQRPVRLFPRSATDFYLRVVKADVRFENGGALLVLQQDGQTVRAERKSPPASAPAQMPEKASPYYSTTRPSADGIGKVYMGREIAQVMGHMGAGWLERRDREAEEAPGKAIALMDLRPTDVVADIGAGTGYFSLRIAPRVPRGKVLAEDIEPAMLNDIRRNARRAGVANIEPILGTVEDPRLPEAGVDVVLMVDAYHEFDHPREMMEAIVRALRPGGRVVDLEYRAEDPNVAIKPHHKMTEAQAVKEMRAVGLEHLVTHEDLPQQHLMVFRKPLAGPATAPSTTPAHGK